jgi:peroxiredoxin
MPDSSASAQPGGAPADERSAPRPAGTPAPEFTLHSAPDQTIALSSLRGRPVILAFYPADWSPVCGDQMVLYNEILEEFQEQGAQLLGVSVDSVWCHKAFAEGRRLRFPLLADFEPKGEVSRAYGAYRQQDGFSERALFVLDASGVVRWSYVSPVGENPGAEGILAALEQLTPEQRGTAGAPGGTPGDPSVNAPADTLAAERGVPANTLAGDGGT